MLPILSEARSNDDSAAGGYSEEETTKPQPKVGVL
jgi:hypothetical protein